MRRIALLALAALTAGAIAACGGAPDELSRDEGAELRLSRDRIVAALETRERLAGGAAERLLARVREIVRTGALEPEQLDEFGLAALGELHLAVPSLVRTDRREIPRELDRESLRLFLENATTDPDAATRRPAATEIDRIANLLTEADASPDTRIPIVDQTATEYLTALERRLRPTWPGLADEVADVDRDL